MTDAREFGLCIPWNLLRGPGVRCERPVMVVELSPAMVQAIIETTATVRDLKSEVAETTKEQ